MAEIYTVCLHSSYTAKNWHVICNENNVIRKFYHPLRMTISLGRELLAKHLRILRLPLSSNKDAEERKMAEFTLRIDGMHCGSCVRRVSQALAAVPGAAVNEVRVGAARVTAAEEPAPVDLAIAALAKAGYTAHLES